MKKMLLKSVFASVAAAALVAGAASADPVEDTLVLNGETEMVTVTAAPAHLSDALDEIYSGWHFRTDETRAMQADDFDNSGMVFVEQAIEDWNTPVGSEGKSCASCHGEPDSMKGVRPVYPKWNEAAGELRSLEMQINDCRTTRMGADPLKIAKAPIDRMVALISSVSRGMPMNVAIDGPVADMWEKGKEMYYTRTGQLELSCASCHEQSYGMMIRADHLSQGQTNGFPVYRLKNAKLTGTHGRFKGCVRDTRAETYAPGSQDFLALELYVASRGNGLSVEGPSIRN